MIIYIDSDFKCHLADDGTMTEVETEFFNGKCQKFIEGYRFVPAGESWTREDGEVFTGEMIAPWQPYELLAAYQEGYEESQAAIAALNAEIEDKTAAIAAYQSGEVSA